MKIVIKNRIYFVIHSFHIKHKNKLSNKAWQTNDKDHVKNKKASHLEIDHFEHFCRSINVYCDCKINDKGLFCD